MVATAWDFGVWKTRLDPFVRWVDAFELVMTARFPCRLLAVIGTIVPKERSASGRGLYGVGRRVLAFADAAAARLGK